MFKVLGVSLALSVLAIGSRGAPPQQELRPNCGGDAALCDWIAKSFGAAAAGLQAIISDPAVVIVRDFRDEIHLMTPAVVVRTSLGARVKPDSIRGTTVFTYSSVYFLPPCQSGQDQSAAVVVSFLPSQGALPLKSEVDAAFQAAWRVFSPAFDLSQFPSQVASGDVLMVRTYSLVASPLSFAKSMRQLDAIVRREGNAIEIEYGAATNVGGRQESVSYSQGIPVGEALRDEVCYRESLTYRSGQGILLVIGRADKKAFVWQQ